MEIKTKGSVKAPIFNMKKKLIELPTELHDKIQVLAKENDRSVNKQIVQLLKKATK